MIYGIESSGNSSITPLAADAVFTGVGEEVTPYCEVTVSWNSDVPAADDGVSLEFSTDNANWDMKTAVDSHSDSIHASNGGVHKFPVDAKFFRVVYTNGSTIQADFRLQTLYHMEGSLRMTRMADQLGTTSDLLAVRGPIRRSFHVGGHGVVVYAGMAEDLGGEAAA